MKKKGPTAKDVMTKKVQTVTAETTVGQLVEKLRATKFSGFPVVDGEGRSIGLVSQNDVLRALAHGTGEGFQEGKRKASVKLIDGGGMEREALLARPVRDVMTPKVVGCTVEAPLAKICATMTAHRVHRVVVLDDAGRVAGLVSASDVVKWVGRQ